MTFFAPSVTPYAILAAIGWLVGIGLIVLDLTVVSNDIGHVGLAVCGASSVLQIRGFLHGLELRQQQALDVWRQALTESQRLHRID